MVSRSENMGVKYVLFVGGGKDDDEAVRIVKKALGSELVVIDVRKDGVRGWMLWEYGTDETPLLTSPYGVFYGLKAIRSFVNRVKGANVGARVGL